MKQPEKPKGFLLRLPADLMKRLQHAQIDSQYNSLNAWIVAAITEKLERTKATTKRHLTKGV